MPTDAANRPVTIVTGGSRGIGAAIAERLAADGHDLVLTYRDRVDDAEAVARRCEASGAHVLVLQVDLADLDAAATVVPAALEHFGTVHRPRQQRRHHRPDRRLPRRVDRRVGARVPRQRARAGRADARRHRPHGHRPWRRRRDDREHLVGAATTGSPNTYIPYSMSKAALNALTTGTAKEFGPVGVRVNTVSPGTTRTEIHAAAGRLNAPDERAPGIPMRRPGEVHEVAGAVAYLLSPDASYTSGADIRVAGGN